ncbi:hypothetical protein ACA910_012067 [Epithemia clementina (nom. ined.)]
METTRMLPFLPLVSASDPNYEYVQEILEQEQAYYGQDDEYASDYEQEHQQQQKQQQQEEAEARRKKELEEEKAARRAQEREAAFEQKLLKLGSQQERHKARQKKKRDAQLVSQVLHASKHGDYYAVLGLRQKQWLSQSVPSWLRRLSQKMLPKSSWLWQITASDLRKAYRSMATRIHPDKNHDGRAEQAFWALEEAYQFLSDPEQRKEYDENWNLQTNHSHDNNIFSAWQHHGPSTKVYQVLHGATVVVRQTTGMVRKVVGPFAVPVSILAWVFL